MVPFNKKEVKVRILISPAAELIYIRVIPGMKQIPNHDKFFRLKIFNKNGKPFQITFHDMIGQSNAVFPEMGGFSYMKIG